MIVIPAIEDVVVVMGVVVTAVVVVTVAVGIVVVGVVGCLKIIVCECVSFSGILKLSSSSDDDELLFCDFKKSGCGGM